jgi:hypothetical protein
VEGQERDATDQRHGLPPVSNKHFNNQFNKLREVQHPLRLSENTTPDIHGVAARPTNAWMAGTVAGVSRSNSEAATPPAANYEIRPAQASDWPGIWTVLEPVIRAGETFTWDRDTSEETARSKWFKEAPGQTFVAVRDGEVLLKLSSIQPLATLGCTLCIRSCSPARHPETDLGARRLCTSVAAA